MRSLGSRLLRRKLFRVIERKFVGLYSRKNGRCRGNGRRETNFKVLLGCCVLF
jgi:hypothetical protein